MPYHCCVYGCRGNYPATKEHAFEKVSIFGFPKDVIMREKWKKLIPNKDLEITDNTVVCEKHFAQDFIIRVDTITRDDGSILSVQRMHPKLTNDAYPSYFPNAPMYLSTEPPTKRKSPDSRRAELDQRDEALFEEWIAEDKIGDYKKLSEGIFEYAKTYSKWLVMRNETMICLYVINFDEVPKLAVSITVHSDLSVVVYKGDLKLPYESLRWLLGDVNKLAYWSQLASLLSHYGSTVLEITVAEYAACLESYIKDLEQKVRDSKEYDDDIADRLAFLCEQYCLLFSSKRRYSHQTIALAFQLMSLSRSVYDVVCEKILRLPTVRYLKKLSAVFAVQGDDNDLSSSDLNSHIAYLKMKADLLPLHEKHVILLLDEIHCKPKSTYKSGKISGMASNNVNVEASTVQTFMFCSLLSSNKDVAALVPVKNLNAQYLKQCTMKVIEMLENVGYMVCCLISDNNRVNRNMFTDICNGNLLSYIDHPFNSERKLFFLFDTVHLLKCIRNNWLGQITVDHTFFCPGIVEPGVCRASFEHVRELYHSEKDNLLKLAPHLTYKSLYPNSIERQNVMLALKVFDEKTAVALVHYGNQCQKDMNGAHQFICLIMRLFNIFNVKSVDKGLRKRDSDCNPIRDVNDAQMVFLRDFYYWLIQWESMNLNSREGCLTSETLFALKHTVQTFLVLVPYLLHDMKLTYVLTGTFQTDPLEGRFGVYRRMSGTNYHISVAEIMESEKKLKITSTLNLIGKFNVSVCDFVASCKEVLCDAPAPTDAINDAGLFDVITECDIDVDVSDAESKSLIFVAGYIAYKLVKNVVRCDLCKLEFIMERLLDYDVDEQYSYLLDIDRGGLKWLTEYLIAIVMQVFFVFQCVMSEKYKSKLLVLSDHKSFIVSLCLERLMLLELLTSECICVCGTSMKRIIESAVGIVVNVLMNNYSKRVTDKLNIAKNSGSGNRTQRKLSTVMK
jgi:hypothetical protein